MRALSFLVRRPQPAPKPARKPDDWRFVAACIGVALVAGPVLVVALLHAKAAMRGWGL